MERLGTPEAKGIRSFLGRAKPKSAEDEEKEQREREKKREQLGQNIDNLRDKAHHKAAQAKARRDGGADVGDARPEQRRRLVTGRREVLRALKQRAVQGLLQRRGPRLRRHDDAL